MTASVHLAMPLSKSLETKVRSAVNVLSRQGEDITRKSIKRELELSEDEWKQHKSAIMEHAQSVLVRLTRLCVAVACLLLIFC